MYKKKLIIFTQWFEPEPTFKGLLFAKELQNQGYEVHVVTGFPNYPGGKLYPGYRVRLFQKELKDGVSINRIPLYPSHDRSPLKRSLNYLSFCFSLITYGLFFMPSADVIYAYHPPLTIGIAAIVIKLFRRIPFVYDIQDLWPDTLLATNMVNNRWVIHLIRLFCQFVYYQANHIVVLSPGFKQRLVDRNVSESKISIIYNWADEMSDLKKSTRNNVFLPTPFLDLKNNFVILFAGNVGKAQGLDTIIRSAEITQANASNIHWVIIGSGLEYANVQTLISSKKLSNVLMLPRVPMAEVNAYLDKANALIVHLRDYHLFEITIPSKIQAYMRVGKPLLTALKGDGAFLVRDAKCGLVVDPEDHHAIAKAAEQLSVMSLDDLSIMAKNASNYYSSNLSLTIGVDQFVKVFDSVIA